MGYNKYVFFILSLLILEKKDNAFAQEVTDYYPGHEIRSKGVIVDSLKEGVWQYFYPDGRLEAIEPYLHNRLNGKVIYYDDRLNVIARENWQDGLQEDSSIYYYPNGKVEKKGVFHDGLYEGLWLFYYKNGKIKRTGYYRNGLPDGHWIYYSASSQKLQEGDYKMNLEVGEWLFYNNQGRLKYSGDFRSGEKTGIWYRYKKNGKKVVYYNYGNSP